MAKGEGEGTHDEIFRYMEKQDTVNKEIRSSMEGQTKVLHEIAIKLALVEKTSQETLVQTVKTNGRVNRLEQFRDFLIGGGAVVAIVWSLFQFIFPYFRSQEVAESQYNDIVDKLKEYEKSAHDQK